MELIDRFKTRREMVEMSEIVRVLSGGAAAAKVPGEVRRIQLTISGISDGFMRRV